MTDRRVDPDALAEALERHGEIREELVITAVDLVDTFDTITAAARAFLEAPSADWCLAHNREPAHAQHSDDCEVGRVRLVAEE